MTVLYKSGLPGYVRGMKKGLIICLGSAILLVASLLFIDHILTHPTRDPDALPTETAIRSAAPHEEIIPKPTEPLQALSKNRIEVSPLVLAGCVLDQATKKPVTLFNLCLFKIDEEGKYQQTSDETYQDEAGRFSFSVGEIGDYLLAFRSSRHLLKIVPDLKITDNSGCDPLEVFLDPGLSLKGRVLDYETGKPLAGVMITPDDIRYDRPYPGIYLPTMGSRLYIEQQLLGRQARCNCTETDTRGCFTLEGLEPEGIRIAALAADYVNFSRYIEPTRENNLEFHLKRGFHVFGKVKDDGGQPLPGLLVYIVRNRRTHCASHRASLTRPVLTDADGSFRTPPTSPGVKYLRVETPFWVKQAPPYVSEVVQIRVVDRDLEMNIGPTAKDITWQGTLYDCEGTPLPYVKISLETFVPASRTDFLSEKYTNASGNFEFKRLFPSSFDISLYFNPYMQTIEQWDQVRFDHPGEVQKDLHLEGGAVSGIVVDGKTGLPFPGERIRIIATRDGDNCEVYSAKTKKEGHFEIHGLKAGAYRIRTSSRDKITTTIGPVEVVAGNKKKDLRIEIPRGGIFSMYKGQKALSLKFKVILKRLGEELPFLSRDCVQPFGSYDTTYLVEGLPVGSWVVQILCDSLGLVERRFEIREGQKYELVIEAADYVSRPDQVSLAGTLRFGDGTPAPGKFIRLIGNDRDAMEEFTFKRYCRSEKNGRYAIDGLMPGTWTVFVEGRSSEALGGRMKEVTIPADAKGIYHCDLTIPNGVVKGQFLAKGIDLAITDEKNRWQATGKHRVQLQAAEDGTVVAEFERSVTSDFQMKGIPPGNYRLAVQVVPYENYLSEPFALGPDPLVDLGDLFLAPAGILSLSLEWEGGSRPGRRSLGFPGRDGEERPVRYGRGNPEQYSIPTPGPVRICVKSKGFETREETYLIPSGTIFDAYLFMKQVKQIQ